MTHCRRRLQALGLRWKIAVLLAVGCSLVAVTIGVFIHRARTHQVADAARSSATNQLIRVRQVYELTGRLDPDKTGETYAEIDSERLPGPLRDTALAGRRSTYLDLSGDHPSVWAARPVGGRHVLSVCQSLEAEQEELADLDRQLVAYGIVVVTLAAVGGSLLASRLSRELRTAAETARRISEGDLDARIGPSGVPGGRDEVAELSSAVDTMAASLQGRLEAEQRFTADVAHELRTPLTGLHTAAELLPEGRPTELVRNRVAALRSLTEDLLEVARLDSNREEAALDVHRLGPLVTSITERSGVAAGITFADGAGAYVRTDVRRLERILGNLLVNARKHGGGAVEVTVRGTTVAVRDHGAGYPAQLLHEGPQRFLTGTVERGQGTGLGLTIALGQAQVIGARVELSNPADGGAHALVTLPPGPAPG
ncbi:HAMP domain-containing histidine kinase [Streptomyces sp. NBC_00536]|uniref:HAMP domain-containing sensor histidine kinase n=1 Tax=Streptomyces sp. NBC_00536 TaxID=2975769 RepID=UPI002E812C50|nr:HAMP domain-containing sensor histidine kinase [Streptomyces sp. NBC_00536]WUC78889.1 HAMP domain-containing histidine kinase [Streptomyces sp. NBC_00536]